VITIAIKVSGECKTGAAEFYRVHFLSAAILVYKFHTQKFRAIKWRDIEQVWACHYGCLDWLIPYILALSNLMAYKMP
jgi:hypothetical protein